MRTGEKVIIGSMVGLGVMAMAFKAFQVPEIDSQDQRIPYFSTASSELSDKAAFLIRQLKCRECHSLWATRDLTQNVPAPRLDGIGSLKTEEWLYGYISAENPQEILPSRLKEQYRMPSYAKLSDDDRRVLASYLSSLKVEDWYLDETKKSEYEKLTGKPME